MAIGGHRTVIHHTTISAHAAAAMNRGSVSLSLCGSFLKSTEIEVWGPSFLGLVIVGARDTKRDAMLATSSLIVWVITSASYFA